MYICIYEQTTIYIYIYVYVCIYIYIYIHVYMSRAGNPNGGRLLCSTPVGQTGAARLRLLFRPHVRRKHSPYVLPWELLGAPC